MDMPPFAASADSFMPSTFAGEIAYHLDEEEEMEVVWIGLRDDNGNRPMPVMLPMLDAVRLAAVILGSVPDDRLALAREVLEDELNE